MGSHGTITFFLHTTLNHPFMHGFVRTLFCVFAPMESYFHGFAVSLRILKLCQDNNYFTQLYEHNNKTEAVVIIVTRHTRRQEIHLTVCTHYFKAPISPQSPRTLVSVAVTVNMGGGASHQNEPKDDEFHAINDDSFGQSPLISVPKKRRYITRQENFMFSELLLACQQGQVDMVKKLLAEGQDVNEVDKYGRTPLILASEKGSIDIAMLLINKKANINVQELRYGKTALISASMQGNEKLLKALLVGGANIDIVDKFGKSALYRAIELHHTAIVLALLSVCANTDSQNDVGRTALLEVSDK